MSTVPLLESFEDEQGDQGGACLPHALGKSVDPRDQGGVHRDGDLLLGLALAGRAGFGLGVGCSADEFRDDLQRWNAELERETLTIRFRAPDILFATATSELKQEFQAVLSDFFPRYLGILHRFKSAIQEVRIEGHTSSMWAGAANTEDAYFKNMALSQSRTRSVLEFGLLLSASEPFREWARRHLTATGLSSSRLILSGGAEDPARSRRVEFRVLTNAKRQIVKIIETLETPGASE